MFGRLLCCSAKWTSTTKKAFWARKPSFAMRRVSYYTGDFNWAQAQLDILKASTSKLISNDAIDLSLLITDNFNMDTLTAPMEMFARADLLRYRNQLDGALATLDTLAMTRTRCTPSKTNPC